ncbi:MAG: lytic transglycosylase domain-containing protein [Casimicrobiaceae bacterium]|nr:lytic transglycosylase domain-containing protein [Casimicrobiaceae bacterium]
MRVGLAALLGCLLTVATPARASDAAVREAAAAFRAGDAARIRALIPATRGHLLEAYVDYWALRVNLELADAGEVEAFIDRHRGTAIGERLRGEWLKLLGRRGHWEAFERLDREADNDDADLSCYRVTMRAVRGGQWPPPPPGVWAERLSDACAAAFAALAMRATPAPLSLEDVLWRFRTAGDGGTLYAAQSVAQALPADLRPSEDAIARAHAHPEAVLRVAANGTALVRSQREVVLYALARLARNDVASARQLWSSVVSRMRPEEQRFAAAQLAYASARRLESAEAMLWWKRASDAASLPKLSDAQLAWLVRAALREGAWREVARLIDAMSPSASGGREEATWRYWRARAHAALGEAQAAREIYQRLAREHHFYGLLAAEEIGQPLPTVAELTRGAVRLTPEAAERFERSPAAQRALKLGALNLRAEAAREWFTVVRDFGDLDSLLAAEWMRQKGFWDRSINTAERTRELHDFRLRFQTPYEREIRRAAAAFGLEPALVFGLIRQESRFWAEAVSSAGALGLMQVMPATGRWIAQQLGVANFQPSQLTDVSVSTTFGSFYLKNALNTQEGSEVRAAAAYNAGAGRARQWRHETRALEGAIYTESIPFNETRDYVKKVLANAVWYAHLLGEGETSLKKRLGTISPKSSTSSL